MNIDEDDFHSPKSNSSWWSRMSRHEQIVAARIGAIVTGLFGIIVAFISSSAGPSHAVSGAVGSVPPSSEPSAALASSSSPMASSSPITSSSATIAAPSSPIPPPDQVAQVSSSPPSPQPKVQYLADLNSVSNLGPVVTGNAEVNGNNYLNSVILEMVTGGSFSVSYDTGRSWHLLEATIGLRDDSPQNEEYEFQVFADGSPIYSQLLSLGQSRHIELNITGVLRIELRATLASPNWYGATYGVWGNADLIK